MRRVALVWPLASSALGLSAFAQTLHYEGAVSLASGTYFFTERTTSATLSSGFAVGVGMLTARLTVPAYAQTSPYVSGTAAGLLPTGGRDAGTVADSSAARRGMGDRGGSSAQFSVAAAPQSDPVAVTDSSAGVFRAALGDPLLSVSVSPVGTRTVGVGLTATVKVPLTDTATFGTGAWDVGGAVSISIAADTRTLVALDLSAWHLGDLPELDLRDPVGAQVAILRSLSRKWAVSLSASGTRSVVPGFADAYQVAMTLARAHAGGVLAASAGVGLSETTPDVVFGLSWRVSLLPH